MQNQKRNGFPLLSMKNIAESRIHQRDVYFRPTLGNLSLKLKNFDEDDHQLMMKACYYCYYYCFDEATKFVLHHIEQLKGEELKSFLLVLVVGYFSYCSCC